MKIIKQLQEGEAISKAIIGWKIFKYTDANVLKVSVYLKVIIFKFEIGIPNGKKRETL